jgi:hypothetical protein
VHHQAIPSVKGENNVSYDHSKKIGNQGDVVKHHALTCIADEIIRKNKKKFVYVESHTGRHRYTLTRNGEWRQGIGLLLPRCAREGSTYSGSSEIVFSLVGDRREFEFILHETDPKVCRDLMLYYDDFKRVKVRREDGYAGVLNQTKASLVLVDPPDLKQPELLIEVIRKLRERNIPFICWTPRIGNSGGPTKIPTEGAVYVKFREDVKKMTNVEPILVRWYDKWRSKTCGCCLHVFPNYLRTLAKKGIDRIISDLGWLEE